MSVSKNWNNLGGIPTIYWFHNYVPRQNCCVCSHLNWSTLDLNKKPDQTSDANWSRKVKEELDVESCLSYYVLMMQLLSQHNNCSSNRSKKYSFFWYVVFINSMTIRIITHAEEPEDFVFGLVFTYRKSETIVRSELNSRTKRVKIPSLYEKNWSR